MVSCLYLFLDLKESRLGVGQLANIFGFVGHTVFIIITQLCCYSTKSAIDDP